MRWVWSIPRDGDSHKNNENVEGSVSIVHTTCFKVPQNSSFMKSTTFFFFFTPFSPQILLRAYLPGEVSAVNAIVAGRATILSSLWYIWGSLRQASRIPDSERCRPHEDSPPAPSPSAPTDEWARRSNWLFWLQIRHRKEGKELECNLSSSHKLDASMTSAYAKEAVLPKLKACLPTPKTSTCCDQRNRYFPLSKVELTTEIKKN